MLRIAEPCGANEVSQNEALPHRHPKIVRCQTSTPLDERLLGTQFTQFSLEEQYTQTSHA
jgi:hypothetical protein